MGQLHEYEDHEAAYQRELKRRETPKVRTLISSDLEDSLVNDYASLKRSERAQRLAATREGKQPAVYAAAVRITRHCGGPEEGGWWYDWSSVEEVRRAHTYRSLLRHVRELQAEYPTSRYGRHSCADTSGDVVIYLCRSEHQIEGLQSTERPRYE